MYKIYQKQMLKCTDIPNTDVKMYKIYQIKQNIDKWKRINEKMNGRTNFLSFLCLVKP